MLVRSLSTNNRSDHIASAKIPILSDAPDSFTQIQKKNRAIRTPLKLCENNYNTNAVVLIENGADDDLVDNESKERFFAEMIQAGVE